MKPAVVIAEIGCNHRGELETAKEMIKVAATYCKVDAVKFQKRTVKELLTPEEYESPHPNPSFSYGSTYGAHREALEFTIDQHRELKAVCDDFGVIYATSVWDKTSAIESISLNPAWLKVPSACNLNRELLDILCKQFKGQIHVSLGMTTWDEHDKIVEFFEKAGRAKDLVLYACTSGYPVPFEDVCLLEISRLKEKFGKRVGAIAFSGHHLGIAVDIAAVTLGAEFVERHYTLDRTWKGTDHAASLEPEGMRRLARDVRALGKALTYKREAMLDIEKATFAKLKRSQVKWQ
jgi:N-acetylneuraminate synthase